METQYGLDLAQVAEWVRGGKEPVLVGEASFVPERLLSLRTRNSAAYKGLYALQMKSGAADWRTTDPLSFATWYQENIDIHHIFPVAWCSKSKSTIPPHLYNSILDLAQVAEWVRGGKEPVLVGEASFVPERLLSLRTRNSAAYKGLYALQMKSGAADWRTTDPLSFATWYQENIDIHHIFPVAWCSKSKSTIPPHLYNSIINKTPIDASTNRKIGGVAPSIYLPRLKNDISVDDLYRVLRAHWINPESLAADQFAKCFVQRGEAMLELIGKVMGKPMPSGEDIFRNALNAAGLGQSTDDFDDADDEHDVVGEWAYNGEVVAAD